MSGQILFSALLDKLEEYSMERVDKVTISIYEKFIDHSHVVPLSAPALFVISFDV